MLKKQFLIKKSLNKISKKISIGEIFTMKEILILFSFKSQKIKFSKYFLCIHTLNKIFAMLLKKEDYNLLFYSLSSDYFDFIMLMLKIGNLKTFKLMKNLLPLLAKANNNDLFSSKRCLIEIHFENLRQRILKAKLKIKSRKKVFSPYSIIAYWPD